MNKEQIYKELLRDLEALVDGVEGCAVGVLANAAALIYERTGYFWVGFYMVDSSHKDMQGDVKNGVLKLGPFQGTPACYRIGYGKGVCGTAWKRGESIVVADVEEFDGHIACSSLSRSEIVVPLFDRDGRVAGVLDIDSTELNAFDDIDRINLESACRIIERNI